MSENTSAPQALALSHSATCAMSGIMLTDSWPMELGEAMPATSGLAMGHDGDLLTWPLHFLPSTPFNMWTSSLLWNSWSGPWSCKNPGPRMTRRSRPPQSIHLWQERSLLLKLRVVKAVFRGKCSDNGRWKVWRSRQIMQQVAQCSGWPLTCGTWYLTWGTTNAAVRAFCALVVPF